MRKNVRMSMFGKTIGTAFAAVCFLAAAAATFADTAEELAEAVNGWNGGGSGTLSAVADGNVVTVTGEVEESDILLSLDIDADVVVKWDASLFGNDREHIDVYNVRIRGGHV